MATHHSSHVSCSFACWLCINCGVNTAPPALSLHPSTFLSLHLSLPLLVCQNNKQRDLSHCVTCDLIGFMHTYVKLPTLPSATLGRGRGGGSGNICSHFYWQLHPFGACVTPTGSCHSNSSPSPSPSPSQSQSASQSESIVVAQSF